MGKTDNKGVILGVVLIFMLVFTIMGMGLVKLNEHNSVEVQKALNRIQSFWTAEAGMAIGIYNVKEDLNYDGTDGWIEFGDSRYSINIDDTISDGVKVASQGSQADSQITVKGRLLFIPFAFENTISSGGDLNLEAWLASIDVFGKTRHSGDYNKSTWWASADFHGGRQKEPDQTQTTISVPDFDGNGTPDEFSDFLAFGDEVVNYYPEDEVVNIETNGTAWIYPDQNLVGKKVVYVHGDNPGTGDVNILFDATWSDDQDLTVISTGTINYIQPLQFQSDARLSIISWEGYNESSIFRSTHESVIYTHSDVEFVDILDWGSNTGNVISNSDVNLKTVLTYERFYFSDKAMQGNLPPGFRFLCGESGNLSTKLVDWEVN